MKTGTKSLRYSLATAALLLAASQAEPTLAQYGGQPMGQIFSGPSRARAERPGTERPSVERAASLGEDPYNPNVWLAQRGPRWNRRAAFAQTQPAPSVMQEEEIPMESSVAPWGERPEPYNSPQEYHEGPYPYEEGPFYDDHYGPGPPHGGCDSCGDCGECRECVRCMPCPSIRYLDVFAGVQGFKGPYDFQLGTQDAAANGNFGFHEGVNLAMPFACYDLGLQLGVQATQTQLEGSDLGSESRNQFFLTFGGFHRTMAGLQYGVVFDWLHDSYGAIDTEADLYQLRGELGLVNCNGNELGVWAAVGLEGAATDNFEALDQYAVFYRMTLARGGDARVWGGFTGEGDGIIGLDGISPISERFSAMVNFNYLIPGDSSTALVDESWNIGLTLVFHLHPQSKCFDPHRPLFGVANNGTFFQHRK